MNIEYYMYWYTTCYGKFEVNVLTVFGEYNFLFFIYKFTFYNTYIVQYPLIETLMYKTSDAVYKRL